MTGRCMWGVWAPTLGLSIRMRDRAQCEADAEGSADWEVLPGHHVTDALCRRHLDIALAARIITPDSRSS